MKFLFKKLTSLRMYIYGFLFSKGFFWKLKNTAARNTFIKSMPALSPRQEKFLEEICKDGVCVTDITYFSDTLFKELLYWKDSISKDKSQGDKKEFLVYYLGGSYQAERQTFQSNNPLIDFSINEKLLDIVNSYFGMLTRLVYLEMNETKIIPTNSQLQQSQNFHRDPGLHGCIKVFIYLNDVEKGDGGFTYIKGTHSSGKYGKLFKSRFYGVGGLYPSYEDITYFEKDEILEISGKAGTVIIADTTGIHRGGVSIKNKRQMTTSVYYPPGDFHKSKMDLEFELSKHNLSTKQLYSVGKY